MSARSGVCKQDVKCVSRVWSVSARFEVCWQGLSVSARSGVCKQDVKCVIRV